jgi:hypothetical protein
VITFINVFTVDPENRKRPVDLNGAVHLDGLRVRGFNPPARHPRRPPHRSRESGTAFATPARVRV